MRHFWIGPPCPQVYAGRGHDEEWNITGGISHRKCKFRKYSPYKNIDECTFEGVNTNCEYMKDCPLLERGCK